MKTLIPVLARELRAGNAVALATVLAGGRGAPRGAGACQILCRDGQAYGTVGGGVLEQQALDVLAALLVQDAEAPRSKVCSYAITQEEARPVPTPAEGNATLLYQCLTPEDAVWAEFLALRLPEGGAWWLVRRLQNGRVTGVGYADGQRIYSLPDAPPVAAVCLRKPVWVTDGSRAMGMPKAEAPQWFAEPISLPGRVYLFGGGHVAQRVAPLLHQLDFPLTVYEERPAYCTEALFPTAEERICAPYAEVADRLPITQDDALLVMTSGHGNDVQLLQMALRTPAYYLGMIGSSRKIAQTKAQLLELGFTEADFTRVHTPVGLPILAETPMEIAVSVAAEMILCRAQQEGRERAARPQPLRQS